MKCTPAQTPHPARTHTYTRPRDALSVDRCVNVKMVFGNGSKQREIYKHQGTQDCTPKHRATEVEAERLSNMIDYCNPLDRNTSTYAPEWNLNGQPQVGACWAGRQ